MRRATRHELDRLASLWAALVAHHAALDPGFRLRAEADWRAVAARLVSRSDAAIFVWEEDGALLGVCAAQVEAAPPILAERSRAEITELYVEPAARRRGVGRALARAALAWAAEQGAPRVEIRVHARNAEGRAFWRALGFEPFVDVLARRL